MKFDINTGILTINFLLYFLWFWRNFKKHKRITPYNFIVLWFSLIAFFAIVIYANGLYSSIYMAGKKDLPTIDCIGLLLVFFSFIILLFPLKKIGTTKMQEIIIPKIILKLDVVFIAFLAIQSLLLVPYSLQAMTMDAVDIYTNGREEGERLLPIYMMRLNTLTDLLFYFLLPYSFYQIRNKITPKYVILIVLLFLCFVQRGVVIASRGSLFMTVACFVFAYLLFNKFYSTQVKAIIKRVAIVAAIVMGIIGIGMTTSRFADKDSFDSPIESIVLYFGESFNNFCFRVWGNSNIIHTHGEVYFPAIYSFITGEKKIEFETTQDRVDYICRRANTGTLNNFVPMYGHLYIEFGWFIPILYMAMLAFLVNLFFNNGGFTFYKIPILMFLFQKLYFYSILSNFFRESQFKYLFYVIVFSFFIKVLFKVKEQ